MNLRDLSRPQPLETQFLSEEWVVFHVLFGEIPWGLKTTEQSN